MGDIFDIYFWNVLYAIHVTSFSYYPSQIDFKVSVKSFLTALHHIDFEAINMFSQV